MPQIIFLNVDTLIPKIEKIDPKNTKINEDAVHLWWGLGLGDYLRIGSLNLTIFTPHIVDMDT